MQYVENTLPAIGTDRDSFANESSSADHLLTTPLRPERYTYFIQAGEGGPIKIGSAKNPGVRCGKMQIGNHEELSILAIADGLHLKEQWCHQRFAKWRIRGEWFDPCPELLELIETLRTAARLRVAEYMRHA